MSTTDPNTELVAPIAFGLIVIGDEVLNGTREDAHLGAFKRLLTGRGHALAWYWMLPDDPATLIRHLRDSMCRPEPVFCCGGIGATPDDHTRACAATAAGVALTRHPGARALIEGQFGPAAYPSRIPMADLPEGSALIPNPHNRIPGFSIRGHWFLPGFPQMAWPMAQWVLQQHYGRAAPTLERSVAVLGVPESRLVPLMRRFGERFPDLKLFSLPHLGEAPHILLGLRGRQGVDEAMAELCAELRGEGIDYRQPDANAETD